MEQWNESWGRTIILHAENLAKSFRPCQPWWDVWTKMDLYSLQICKVPFYGTLLAYIAGVRDSQ